MLYKVQINYLENIKKKNTYLEWEGNIVLLCMFCISFVCIYDWFQLKNHHKVLQN